MDADNFGLHAEAMKRDEAPDFKSFTTTENEKELFRVVNP
jgi:hypothetical protein